MNDFTKEELQETLFGLEQWCHPSCDYPNYIALRKKIQAMIDSYCEHEPEGDWHICVDKCKKCGAICNDN
jgi:hypothetical protein